MAIQNSKPASIYDSPTFNQDIHIHVGEAVGSASIAPSGRDVVLASQQGLHIVDLDAPFSPPRHLRHQTPWTPADVQWSPFGSRYYWIASTSNQRALVWNLELPSSQAPIQHVLHAHSRAITDINFSAHHPDILATCAVDSFVHCWDLRASRRPAVSFCDWFAGATQVKWNRQDSHIVASSHDRFLRIWDDRNGALPLKTIDAHATKIYGIDWNRTHATKVITCSLDKTIKLWDYAASETEPERIIHTPFPVWRARHTPFGWGVLAMPQRGDHHVHMYDSRTPEHDDDKANQPGYSFEGHSDHVKEFLWRARGGMDNNIDERDFQLVTWGADQELVLHRMQDKQYRTVGWHKGMHLDENWELTRRGAPYKTYRDEMVIHDVDGFDALSAGFNGIHRSSTSPGMSKVPIPVARGWTDGGSMMTYSGLQTRNVYSNDRETNLIAWMKGIKIGKRGSAMPEKERPRSSTFGDSSISGTLNEPEKLSDEIIHVADTYKKVKLEEADISARRIKVSLNGPWGYDSKPAYIQLRADFPSDYPEKSVPNLDIERTSSIPEATLDKLNHEMAVIAGHFVSRGHGCLEAVLSYLLGERSLEESTGLLIQADDEEGVGGVTEEDESSSDEEDVLMGDSAVTQSETLDMGGITGTGVVLDNTKVPLPKRCGALWAPNGRLVCFFPPKEPQPSVLREIILAESGKSGRTHIFEGFGRLNVKSPELKAEAASLNGAEDDESDEYESTSSSSSDSDGFRVLENRFNPPTAWRGASLRFQKLRSQSVEGSQRTSTSLNRRGAAASKDKTIVSLYDLDYLISAHRSLAEGYAVFGWGPDVCSHNAAVASEHGFEDLADMWQFAKLILCNDVPLEIITLGLDSRKEDVNVLAKRALVSIKRKDSGLDLSFDEPEAVSKPQLTARVKWGNHPLASAWLIRSLFQHCEQRGDVQMLAMLSCVFAEPPAKTDKSLPRDLSPAHKIQSMALPSYTPEYAPSEEVAIGSRQPMISVSASPKISSTPATAYGSADSSEGARGSKTPTSEPTTPFSTGSTPPMGFPRGSTSTAQSYSNSPDAQRVSVPNSVNSLGILARPFQLAASPPQRPKLSGEDASTPSASGVTWGPSTVFGSNATLRKTYQAHSPYDVDSDTEEDEPAVPSPGVKITLKNQHLFDDEAYPTVPLLDPKDSAKFVCYRDSYAHLLDAWGLTIQKNEILKLNGFTSLVADVSIDASAQTTFPLTKGDPANVEASNTQGLEIVRFCGRCGKSGTVNTRAGGRCANCGGRSPTLSCSICYESIFGLYKACLNCGHIAHLSCLQLLLESSFDDDQLKCEAGCGCECDHQAAVTIDEILGVEEEKQPSAAMPNQEPSWEYLHHRLNSGIHRRGSVGEGRRPSGFADRIRQDPRRTSNAAIMRTRTKSYEH